MGGPPKMKRSLLSILVAAQLLALLLVAAPAWSQATGGTSAEISCPASGSSANVIVANTRNFAWVIVNTSDTDVRIGFIAKGLTSNLTTGTSIVLRAGSSISDDLPGTFVGGVNCMSTTASAKSISFMRTSR